MSNSCFAVKDENGFYYCGYNAWDNQLRNAKLYHSVIFAKLARDDVRWMERETKIIKVTITEEYDYNPDLEV